MNIVVFTNTYLPHIGGVANSIHRFTSVYRRRGHRVLIVAPRFEGQPREERNVIRVSALQNFNGSDFSVALPAPAGLAHEIEEFEPQIVHSHHPFLLGDTALRVAASLQLPLVFTHHTMYEYYTHYVPVEAVSMKEIVLSLVTGYCNMCDHVIAPSHSVSEVLHQRNVRAPISVVPTGVDTERYQQGNRRQGRKQLGIEEGAFVFGHVGRLAPEKNLAFLARAVVKAVEKTPDSVFLVVGDGPSRETIEGVFQNAGLRGRLIMAGKKPADEVIDCYHAMDLFAFASKSETQGMVLAEAMAAGLPVVALDASGVREVMCDGQNGRLLQAEDVDSFAHALVELAALPPEARQRFSRAALDMAASLSTENCAARALALYHDVIQRHVMQTDFDDSTWRAMLRTVQEEWRLWTERVSAATAMFMDDASKRPPR